MTSIHLDQHSQNQQVTEHFSTSTQLRIPDPVLSRMRKGTASDRISSNTHPMLPKRSYSRVVAMELSLFRFRQQSPPHIRPFQQCQICMNNVKAQEMMSLGCEHEYCRNCMHSYVLFKIWAMQPVLCPCEGCSQVLKQSSTVFNELPDKAQEKFREWERFRNKGEDQRLCPKPSCHGKIKVGERRVSCPDCGAVFCSQCWMPFHSGECDRNAVFYMEASMQFRQCRKCSAVVERIYGCDHITCTCGYQFCYRCGEEWTNDHQCHRTPDCCYEWICCWVFWKIIYLLLYSFVGYPLLLFRSLSMFVMVILSGLIIGIFVGPCLLLQKLEEQKLNPCLLMILFIIGYPILMLAAMVLIAYQFLEQSIPSIFSVDICCGPCRTTSNFCEQVQNRP